MRVHAAILTACWMVVAVAQSNDGSNLETFPSIINPSSTLFNPSSFPSAPGPAIPPSLTSLPSESSSASAPARTTLISAQPRPSNASSSASMTTTAAQSESVVTSTVDGSVTTVTITNTAKPSSGAKRRLAGFGTEGATGVGLAVMLGVAGGALLA